LDKKVRKRTADPAIPGTPEAEANEQDRREKRVDGRAETGGKIGLHHVSITRIKGAKSSESN
jgi:hypothetical protein